VQAPVVQNQAQRDYSMDDYPQGCNAVVAVISYTGELSLPFLSLFYYICYFMHVTLILVLRV